MAVFTGDARNNRFILELGDNFYTGGAGADTFSLGTRGAQFNIITDFTLGEDILSVAARGIVTFDMLNRVARQDGDDVRFDFLWNGEQETLVLQNVQLSALSLSEVLFAPSGIVTGSNGADMIFVDNSVNRTVNGFAGDDIFYVDLSRGHSLRPVVVGGNGDDQFFGEDGDMSEFRGQAGDDTAEGGFGSDTFLGGDGDDTLSGNGGGDQIFGGNGDDRIFGGEGDDALYGDEGGNISEGDDEIIGGAGDDWVFGNGGNDRLFGGMGQDEIGGGDGADELFGGAGDDHLHGGDGDDAVAGNAGDDVLTGGAGENAVSGGDGADVFFNVDGGVDRVGDFEVGVDVVRIDGAPVDDIALIAVQDGDDVVVDTDGGDGASVVRLIGVQLSDLDLDDFAFTEARPADAAPAPAGKDGQPIPIMEPPQDDTADGLWIVI